MNLVLCEALLVRVFDCHSCRLYRGAYISLYQMGEWGDFGMLCMDVCVVRCWRRAMPQCVVTLDAGVMVTSRDATKCAIARR